MAQRILVLPGEIVKKSNALLRARWSPASIWEPRLVALLASKVRADDDDFQVYEIHVSELLGLKYGGSDSKAVEAAVDSAMSRVLTLRDEKGWTKYHVFSRCRYRASDGVLELGFHPDLRSHYLGLKEKFGQYNLTEFMLLPSVYSQRIFELLKSWHDKPEFMISLPDLFLTLDVPATLQRYPDFRRKVLEKAHKDLTTRTGLRYDWEPVKKGRSVSAIRFTFGTRSKHAASSKQQASSAQNNALMKKALSCYQIHGKSCSPKSSRQCDLCLRLVRKNENA
jgi:plasmid replication initiation protein